MTSSQPGRRWFSYSLRSALAALAIACSLVSLGPDAWLAYRRHNMLHRVQQAGGRAETLSQWDLGAPVSPPPPEFSRIRKWLGDEPIALIWLPLDASSADAKQVATLFPEADFGREADQLPRMPGGSLGPSGVF